MTKPDLTEPGIWVADDGTVACVRWSDNWGEHTCVQYGPDLSYLRHGPPDAAQHWRKVDLTPPEKPVYPPKPKVCLVAIGGLESGPVYRWRSKQESLNTVDYTVVPHPDNDPEAVEYFNQWNNNGAT